MSFFLVNLAYAGKFVLAVIVVIVGNDSLACTDPNDMSSLRALDLFNQMDEERCRTTETDIQRRNIELPARRRRERTSSTTQFRLFSPSHTKYQRECWNRRANRIWAIIQMNDWSAYLKTIDVTPALVTRREDRGQQRPSCGKTRIRERMVEKENTAPFRSTGWTYHNHTWHHRKELYSISLGFDWLSTDEFHTGSYHAFKWQHRKLIIELIRRILVSFNEYGRMQICPFLPTQSVTAKFFPWRRAYH